MSEKNTKMKLKSYADLFSTEEQRQEAQLEKVQNISIKDIVDFPKHPFKVVDNEEMQELVDSIRDKTVLVPAIVRPKEDGKYELISGHRRKKASEILKLDTLPCIVRDLTDDEATIIMVDSNLQREKILPSEKAFAYKMKLEAISHQGQTTSRQVVGKLESADIIGKQNNESGRQVQRFIRLTYLIPDILDMVDNDTKGIKPSIAFNPAVELSFLTEDEQTNLLDIMQFNDCTPSLSQAINLKKKSQDGVLTVDDMEDIMAQSKPNQTPKLAVSMNRLENVLPKTLRNDREREEYVIKAVEFYDQYQKQRLKKKELER